MKTGIDMDENLQASLKNSLQEWANVRQQALLEQVMVAWSNAVGHFTPDDALVESLMASMPASQGAMVAPPREEEREDHLGQGLDLLDGAATQGQVLKQLLDGLQPFVERSALFVIKQGIATIYTHRGFDGESPKAGAPVVPPPELEELILGHARLIAAPGPAYLALLAPLSRFQAKDVRIIPLHLRRKIVALLLVDSGLAQTIDQPSNVRALALGAEARLSYLAGQKEEEKAPPQEAHPSTLTQRIPDAIAEPPTTVLDPRVRINAERSARVLVGDIELYFPAKVAQGQQQGNLYAPLRDELDRSRASFVERYGIDLENQHQIFYQTVVHQLCNGDASRLGPAPWAAQ
jgi:hypothetical protein